MRRSGVITLYDKWENIADSRKFDCPYDRKKIMEGWQRRYASAMDGCFIQIFPNSDPEKIKENGTNFSKGNPFPKGNTYKSDYWAKIKKAPHKVHQGLGDYG